MNPSASSSESRRDDRAADPLSVDASSSPQPDSVMAGPTQLDAMAGQRQDAAAVSARFAFLTPPRGPEELGWLGPYRIRGVLGEGGMGVVFDAEDSQLCRRVALKILKPELALTPQLRERFLQEARAAAALPSEHVVAIYQVGSEDDVPFLAMQYLEGESLEQYLRRVRRLSATETAQIGRDIALGLSVAHAKGLIHRDIKPANIWLETAPGGAPPRVKLLDFGLVRAVGGVSNLTASGMIVGTPHYLAPEQARGLEVDHRCDLFALGCVLYQALTATLPFDGPDLLALLSSLAVDEPRPIHDFAPETPAEMVQLVRELFAKSPTQRPATARAVAERLQSLSLSPSPALSRLLPSEKGNGEGKGSSSRFGTGLFLGVILASMVLLLGLWSWIKTNLRPAAANVDCALRGHPLSVGILQARSGSWASASAPLVEAAELAINEINEQGGVLGSRVEPIYGEGASDSSDLAAQTNRLIVENHVCAVFGCCSPAGRKQILPVVEKYNHLLFYLLLCEGLEQSPNIVYVGAAPNQHILPGLQFAIGTLRKRRLFLVGSDTVSSRTAHAILRDAVASSPEVRIVGEALFPVGGSDVKEAVSKIAASKADLVLNTINGDTKVAFFRTLRAGVSAEKVPTLSFHLDENELRALPVERMIGDYAVGNYFQCVSRPENTAFVNKFRARFGPSRVLSDAMESAYVAVHLWARAVKAANDATPAAVRPALHGLEINGPGGLVRIDAASQYAWKVVRIAKIDERGQLKMESSSEEPRAPQPFPPSRERQQWRQFLEGIQRDYGGRWER